MKNKTNLIFLLSLIICISQACNAIGNKTNDATINPKPPYPITAESNSKTKSNVLLTTQLEETLLRCQPRNLTISPNQQILVALCEGPHVNVFELVENSLISVFDLQLPHYPNKFFWSNDSMVLAMSGNTGVYFLSLQDQRISASLEKLIWSPIEVAWSKDNSNIAITVPGGSLAEPTEAYVKILAYPSLEINQKINIPGKSPYGTYNVIWNGEIDNPEFYINANRIIRIKNKQLNLIDFTNIEQTFPVFMEMKNEKLWISAAQMEDQELINTIAVINENGSIIKTSEKMGEDNKNFDCSMSAQLNPKEDIVYVLFASGKLASYRETEGQLKLVNEIILDGITSKGSILLWEKESVVVALNGTGSFTLLDYDFNNLSGEQGK